MSMEVAAVVKATKTSSSSTTSSSSEIITEAAATMSGATRSKRSLTKPSPPVTTSSRGGKKKREADPEIENIAGASATSDAASTPPPSASLTVSSPQVKFDLGGADSQSETTSSSSSSSSSSLSSSTNKKSSAPNNNSTSSAAANSANRNLLKTLNKNPTDSPSSHAVKKQPNLKNIEEEVVVNVDEDTVDCFSIPSNNNNNNSKTKSNHVNNSNHLNHHNNHTHLNNHSNHHAAAKKRTEQNHTKQQEQENNNPREKVLLNGNGEDEEVEVEEEESSSSASQLITKQSSIDVGEETNDANDSSNILAPIATTDAGGEKKVEKKRKQRRSSIHLMNNNLSSLHITSVAQLFVYNWPPSDSTQDENKTFTDEEMEEREKDRLIKVFMSNFNEMFCLQEQFSEYLGVKSFKRKYPDIFRRFIDIKEREYLKDHKVVSETQCDLGLTALNINDCLDLMADDYPEKYKEFSEFLEEKRRRAFADNAIKEKKRLVIALQSQKLLGEELEGETNATNTTTTTTSNSTAPTTTTVRPQLSESDRMKELIKKAIKSVAKYNSQMQKEISDERRKYFDLQTMRLHCKTNPVKYNCQGDENPSSSPSALKPKTNNRYPVALLAGQFQYHYEKYTPEEKLNLPLTTVMTSRPTPPEILYVEWKKKTDPTTATKNDEPKHKTGYLGTHYSTTPHLSHLATTPSSSHLTSTTTPLTSSASRSLRVKDRTSFKYQSSDDEASNDSKPTNHRSMASPQLTATKTRTASTSSQHSSSSQPQSTIRITASAAPTIAKIISSAHKTCYVCQKPSSLPSSSSSSSLDHNQLLIQCSSCQHASHPNCLELNPQLVDWECIRSYDWQCIECKRCSGCQRTQDEDKMMFCDRCDRGFHTYCVGLGEVPSGSWLCTECSGWQDKLRGLSEKYNERTATTSPLKPPPLPSSPAAVAISPSVQLQLKSKINSTSSVKRLSSATSHVLLDDSISAKRGRGRPKGSLNKVKDGSSPLKKTPKKESLSSPTKITSASFDYSNSNGDFAVGVIGHNEESLSYADYSSSSYADNSTQPQRLQFN